MIPQHKSPKLSELDLMVARAVPPGGNWKDVPESVPSKRLETVRQSYARGEGSRSTYYGRLAPDAPSYTISTYFTRPGNGCHLHYDIAQLRTISYREAARLQSFPDSFEFCGPYTAIAKQIGNAVPPLLAYVLARQFGPPGELIDLFAGAGGLALGFKWAGWESAVASDIDQHAIDTFAHNIGGPVVVGDIRDPTIRNEIVATCGVKRGRRVLVGGPPCQGFSTAGKRRSMDDERNHLFRDYCRIVEATDPDVFLFENVTGLLNMERGNVFKQILAELNTVAAEVRVWRVAADEYGVPQRRNRVIVAGFRHSSPFDIAPPPLTAGMFGGPPVGVLEALGDLPPIAAGVDGSELAYVAPSSSAYQALMRGEIQPAEYYAGLEERRRSGAPSFASSRTAEVETRRGKRVMAAE